MTRPVRVTLSPEAQAGGDGIGTGLGTGTRVYAYEACYFQIYCCHDVDDDILVIEGA